jgi:predicted transcriptional regulator
VTGWVAIASNLLSIDDLAATARLSKKFVSDVELGKPTVQLGRVLQMLDELGVRVYLDVPKEVEPHLAKHRAQIEKVSSRRKSKSPPESE